ncbi:MmgE/PrpD family protein [Amycolatopsis sp. La24]|uniref:MmgE/PrpD family protein n=1 Tax=Amycolatopsis sp. La24 TaxID=3028304 RepID=UPI0023AE6FBC|nr:MmgE/PrpD family protein [Amycolatopsis sp. La24]
MGDDLAGELADFCVGTTTALAPADVLDKAKLCLTDFLSAALVPSDESRIALRALGNPRAGAALVLGAAAGAPAPAAAYLTSVPAAATGRTDTHVESSSHPGMVVFPALLALAGQHEVSGLNHWARAATQEHVLHSATAARTGVESALLAAAGLIASGGAVDGEAGLLAAFGARDRAHRLAGGPGFAIRDIVHKPAPACIYVQGPCQLAEEIGRRHRPDPARVESVRIGLAEQAVRYPGCDNSGPISDVVAAQLSVQFSVASVLASGGILDRNWRNPADPQANRLAARSRLVADPGLTARFPARNGSWVRVLLDDGQVLVAEQDTFPSMNAAEIVRRFHAAADRVYGRAGSEAILARVDRLDRTPSASGLLRALQPR